MANRQQLAAKRKAKRAADAPATPRPAKPKRTKRNPRCTWDERLLVRDNGYTRAEARAIVCSDDPWRTAAEFEPARSRRAELAREPWLDPAWKPEDPSERLTRQLLNDAPSAQEKLGMLRAVLSGVDPYTGRRY